MDSERVLETEWKPAKEEAAVRGSWVVGQQEGAGEVAAATKVVQGQGLQEADLEKKKAEAGRGERVRGREEEPKETSRQRVGR